MIKVSIDILCMLVNEPDF